MQKANWMLWHLSVHFWNGGSVSQAMHFFSNFFNLGKIMLRHLLLLCFLVVIHSRHVRHRRWGATTLRPAVELQDIPIIGFGEEISFHANQTWLHFRTEELPMGTRDKQCAEARFRIEGKRTRWDFVLGWKFHLGYDSTPSNVYCLRIWEEFRLSSAIVCLRLWTKRGVLKRRFHETTIALLWRSSQLISAHFRPLLPA